MTGEHREDDLRKKGAKNLRSQGIRKFILDQKDVDIVKQQEWYKIK